MQGEHRKTIVKEIDYWQRSKLLPDQYCDFLRNLYMDAEQERSSVSYASKAARAAGLASGRQWLFTFGIFSLIFFVALHFSAFHPALQITILLASVTLSLIKGQRVRRKNEIVGVAWISFGMLLLLVGGLYMLSLHSVDSIITQLLLLSGCSLLWIMFGIAVRIPILHLCGWIAAMLIYALLLNQKQDQPPIYEIELNWLPGTVVFGWIGWFVHRWSRSAAFVLLAVAGLMFFMPEIYIVLFRTDWIWLQVQFIGKIAIGGVLLFTLRKKWIAWVA